MLFPHLQTHLSVSWAHLARMHARRSTQHSARAAHLDKRNIGGHLCGRTPQLGDDAVEQTVGELSTVTNVPRELLGSHQVLFPNERTVHHLFLSGSQTIHHTRPSPQQHSHQCHQILLPCISSKPASTQILRLFQHCDMQQTAAKSPVDAALRSTLGSSARSGFSRCRLSHSELYSALSLRHRQL